MACNDDGQCVEDRLGLPEHFDYSQEPLREFQLLYKDTTPEGLFLTLSRSVPTAALATDEAEVFFKSSMSSARGHLNTLWDGRDTIVMRATKDNIVLEDVRLMLLLMTQPGVLSDYVAKQGQQARDSGLLARFIVCAPPSMRGSRMRELHCQQEWNIWSKADQRLRKLAHANRGLAYACSSERAILKFSENAALYWIDVVNEIEAQMGAFGRFEACPDHASKLAENIARVASLIHVFEGYDGDITTDTVKVATDLCCFYSGEFQRVFLPPPQDVQDALLLQSWFDGLRQFNKFSVRYNEVRQNGPVPLRDKKRLKDAIDVLVGCNNISIYTEGKTRYISLTPMTYTIANASSVPLSSHAPAFSSFAQGLQ